MDKSIPRFAPIFQHEENYGKLFGALIMAFASVLSIGSAVIGALYLGQGAILHLTGISEETLVLVLVLAFYVPLSALDSLFMSLFAVFAGARSIFFMRHVLSPFLKLLMVLMIIWWQGDVFDIAAGYVWASLIAVSSALLGFIKTLANAGLLQHFSLRSVRLPFREMLTFSLSLMSSDLAFILRGSLVMVLLGVFAGTNAVAEFRAVLPAARLNEVVLTSFSWLFTPRASTLFAQKDEAGLHHLYWQSMAWVMVLTFPIFACSFSLAKPLVVGLFGHEYAGSYMILALLSLGYFVQTVLGFNGRILKVLGKMKPIIILDLVAIVLAIGLNLILIPAFGTLGAAVSVCGTMIIHALLRQVAMTWYCGVKPLDRRYGRACFSVIAGVLALLLMQWQFDPPLYAGMVMCGFLAILVFVYNRELLEVGENFPELLRSRFIGRLLLTPR